MSQVSADWTKTTCINLVMQHLPELSTDLLQYANAAEHGMEERLTTSTSTKWCHYAPRTKEERRPQETVSRLKSPEACFHEAVYCWWDSCDFSLHSVLKKIIHKCIQGWSTFTSPFLRTAGSLATIQHLSGTWRKAEAQMSHRLVLWEEIPWPLHWAVQSLN